MGILKVSREKVGPSPIVNVDMGLNDTPVFPDVCPCCCERTEKGAYIVARCEGHPPLPFPACAACAKHTRIENKIASVVGPGIFWLTVLTVAGFFFVRGMNNLGHPEAGLGWRLLAGLSNLRFPFMSLIHAGLTALGGVGVLVVYLFIYKGISHLCLGHLEKKSCKWFRQAARAEQGQSGPDGKPQRRIILENPAYAAHFIKVNGGEPKVP